MNIIVLCGGLSNERDVSLTSGALIANALRRCGHRCALLDLYLGGTADFTLEKCEVPKVGDSHPDIDALIASNGGRTDEIGEGVIEACRTADVTFLALHGGIGENGTIQALLDDIGVKYTGSGHIGSALAMDKDMTKRVLGMFDVPTAKWVKLDRERSVEENTVFAAETVGCPCVIKPLDGGSSVGVSFADDHDALRTLIRSSLAESTSPLIVERRLIGREFSCGVLCGKALPPIEIIPKVGFYDYNNKYKAGSTDEICPAVLSDSQTKRIMELALKAHNALGLSTYSRADFILDEREKDFICLEVNNLPGMTPTSLLPQEAAAVGITYEELCETIVNEAVGR